MLLALLAILLFQEYVLGPLSGKPTEVPYSAFREALDDGRVLRVVLHPDRVEYDAHPAPADAESKKSIKGDDGQESASYLAIRVEDEKLTEELLASDVESKAEKPPSGFMQSMFALILP